MGTFTSLLLVLQAGTLSQPAAEVAPPAIVKIVPLPERSPDAFVPEPDELLAFAEGAAAPNDAERRVLAEEHFLDEVATVAEPALLCMAQAIKTQSDFGSRAQFDQHRLALRTRCKAVEAQAGVAAAIGKRIPTASEADRAAWSAWLLSQLLLWAALSR
jgi:hypothetical protein